MVYLGGKQKDTTASGSLLCSSCGEGWGIHNLIQIDGLVWLVGRLRQDSTQASGWRKINHEIMYADWSRHHYFAALFIVGCMHNILHFKTMPICIYSACNLCLLVSAHCKLMGVVFFVWFLGLFTFMCAMILSIKCDLQSLSRVNPNLYHS